MSRGHQIPCKQKYYLTRFSVNLRMFWLLKMSLNKACLLGSENRNFHWWNFSVWGISAHSKTQDGDKKYLPYIDVNHPDISQKTTNPQTCVILDLQGTHPSKETNPVFPVAWTWICTVMFYHFDLFYISRHFSLSNVHKDDWCCWVAPPNANKRHNFQDLIWQSLAFQTNVSFD